MQKQLLMLTTSAFILTCGAFTASAQQTPDQQPTMQRCRSGCANSRTPWLSAATLKTMTTTGMTTGGAAG
jgi:hypothetical protein